MSGSSIMEGAGAQWVLGAAGADRYPTDGIGGADVDPEDSSLLGAKVVLVYGVNVITADTTVEVIHHDGSSAAVLVGMTFDASVVGPIWLPEPARVELLGATLDEGLCNIGIRCNDTSVASLFYEKLA